ncbi:MULTISPECIES: type IV pilus modification protein PilV [unclassified Janthinobacterium]|uniref:type IV pilus modification protein PilV n=1 Tax=unclassified Janthinobacterium TaxID=2610881 RepID=UPI0016201ABF|nr:MULTISPECIES: type IV pilus modification protein PilV [unclassified Janthinobacterium]MBB5609037.1 type IV pilus assembly protein PilV [Janthinobacterium sp. S3T4]MBB5614232.1 type IV pilus assembly protein PilV [Janthinobacterium sp. S3M3]
MGGGSHGSSLVEVLVALLLLALGILGGSVLHLASLRARHESALLSTAAQLAAGMAERMRANSGLADADNPYLDLDYDALLDAGAGAGAGDGGQSACFGAAACTRTQLAQFDIAEWKQQLSSALPGGRLLICRDLQAWDTAVHGLHWTCSGGSGAPIVIKLGWRGRQMGVQATGQTAEALPRLAMQLGGGSS